MRSAARQRRASPEKLRREFLRPIEKHPQVAAGIAGTSTISAGSCRSEPSPSFASARISGRWNVHPIRRSLHRQTAALAIVSCLAIPRLGFADAAAGPPASAAALSRIHIENFGQVNSHYYRGSAPRDDDYANLAALGVKLVVDLRGDDGEAADQGTVERSGMRYVHLPMTTHAPPTPALIETFLRLVTEPANQPVYVHCVGGRHRTGVMTAIYRMSQEGWTPAQAFKEMKSYKFGPDFLHPEFKRFVFGYHPSASSLAGAAQ